MNSAAQVLERLKALARLVLAASVGLALLLDPPRATPLFPLLGFIFALYFVYASLALFFYRELTAKRLQAAALTGDGAALGVVLLFASTHSTAFLLFFLYFALLAGLWRGWPAAAGLSVLFSAVYVELFWRDPLVGLGVPLFVGLSRETWAVIGGLLVAGVLVGTLAQRERRHVERAAEVERFARLLSLDTRWPELWKRWLKPLAARFRARRILLAYHEPETDRVTLWQFGPGEGGGLLQESDRPPRDARAFMLESAPLSLLGNLLDRAGAEEWQLRHELSAVATVKKQFSLPGRFREEFSPRSLLSAPLLVGEGGRARLFLLDAEGGEFTLGQLDDLQWLLAGLAPMLANVLTVRSLILRAVNEERDEISRALHDGVAQTLASLEMQLKVYQRLAAQDPARTAEELKRLQEVVRQEQEALRRFVRTLKPVRVPAGELNRWVLAHCAQFQEETGIEVEVEAEPVEATLPEGVCREVFLILREALHNVRKHAKARRVLVRLRQDDSFVRLLVDDDGQGFPFSGTYTQTALEEKGLLPVSIGEHTRALGGTLSIDSTPGSGATLRVEIPLH